jgi:small ligand-binding sensory domain FIST
VKWASAISENPVLGDAATEVGNAVRRELGRSRANLVLAFISPHHADGYRKLPELVSAQFPDSLLLGCSANGVIGAGHEVEQSPAFSLTAAALPGVDLVAFRVSSTELPAETAKVEAWTALVGAAPTKNLHFLLLADPFTFDATALISGLDAAYPDSRKIGGLASGGELPGSSSLFLNSRVWRDGAVGVALSGNISIDTIVAQGCRPVGTPMMITGCQGNVLLELDGRPPLLAVRELFESLPEKDQALLQTSLFVGLEMKSEEVEFHPGDFLVRNIVGMDPNSGAIAIGATPKQWQVMQFLLRDSQTATEDLTRLLSLYRGSAKPHGALLFSCLGRGIHLFGRPDHDTGLFREKLGPIPLGGFFCNGEIGPVGASTFLHGYTSAFALFREADRASATGKAHSG